jgi:galactokinase
MKEPVSARMSSDLPRHPRALALSEFARRLKSPPAFLVRSPGRVNLIGEHTDYNDGFVLPLAIDRATWIALKPRTDHVVSLYSLDFNEAAQFSLSDLARGGPDWIEYAKGVTEQLLKEKLPLRGFDAVIATDVPVGAGLSSSASFSLAVARAFHAVSGFAWDPAAMARLCQRVEIQRIGVNCGIMDQLVIASARDGQALIIDCRSFAVRPVPLPAGHVVVILDTRKSRTLAGSAYNERRAQCETAARFFGAAALRDVSLTQLAAAEGKLDPLVWRRARHVVSEDDRVEQAAAALAAGDARKLGRLMNESHESLRTDYAVSCTELDEISGLARTQPGCLGARMTGAGFGGCAVALVEAGHAEALVAAVGAGYQKRFGVTPSLYVTRPSAGVGHEAL